MTEAPKNYFANSSDTTCWKLMCKSFLDYPCREVLEEMVEDSQGKGGNNRDAFSRFCEDWDFPNIVSLVERGNPILHHVGDTVIREVLRKKALEEALSRYQFLREYPDDPEFNEVRYRAELENLQGIKQFIRDLHEKF